MDPPKIQALVQIQVGSAQTERRGGAGPVRGLLGGKASPAVSLPYQESSQGAEGALSSNSRLTGRASHTFAVWSAPPVTIRDPSALHDAE